ncbi:hypothetical protein C8R48DRAFT_721764 [Suillus tomentosus]|nr:hypothetical protein C8R48DRAFT_721764 [Suillus tomentosus]
MTCKRYFRLDRRIRTAHMLCSFVVSIARASHVWQLGSASVLHTRLLAQLHRMSVTLGMAFSPFSTTCLNRHETCYK